MRTIIILLLATALAVPAWAQPWPETAPRIGNLYLTKKYWDYMKEAAQRYQISPFLIEAVCAIESRFDPDASSERGRCFGLMQLERGTAKKLGFNAHDPRQNIMGGAAVLARLMQEHHGDINRVLHVYNARCTRDYVYQVILAYNQALRCESQTPTRLCETSTSSGLFNN